jgi:hypothetical protein
MNRPDVRRAVTVDEIGETKCAPFADFHGEKISLWCVLCIGKEKRAFARANFNLDEMVVAKDVVPPHCWC